MRFGLDRSCHGQGHELTALCARLSVCLSVGLCVCLSVFVSLFSTHPVLLPYMTIYFDDKRVAPYMALSVSPLHSSVWSHAAWRVKPYSFPCQRNTQTPRYETPRYTTKCRCS